MQWPWQLHWDLRRWEGNADDADDLVRIRKGKTGWKKAVSASERTDGGRGTVVGNCPKIQPASCRARSSSYPTPIPVSGFFLQVVFAHIGSQYFSLGKSYCLKIQPASCRTLSTSIPGSGTFASCICCHLAHSISHWVCNCPKMQSTTLPLHPIIFINL